MKAKAFIAVLAVAAAVGATGCGGGQGAVEPSGGGDAPQEQEAALDFDGSGMSDTGAGTMILRTAGGTSEGGNVPEIANPGSDGALVSIELDYEGGDGSVCDIYIDGMAYDVQINASEYMVQQSLALTGPWLEPGEHKVEVVAMDGDTVIVYKSASYSVAE